MEFKKMNDKQVRVRIAPSPSGNLHVGTARTALFNYLCAKKNGGKYILRIEDTDLERTEQKYIDNIYDSLKAIGLNWDEGPDVGGPYAPYQQSERFDIYKKYAQKLLDEGYAYECFCTQEELDAEKEQAIKERRAYKYSGKCRHLTPEQKEELRKQGKKPVLRFAVPEGHMKFKDLVKGELEFDLGLVGDFVIMKSNGIPTYNFAVVVDDIEMKMTHIIRGEDHISNTPKQIMIYNALGAEVPQFAHVGMILAPDKSKLSKRHGATAVSDFIAQGYLPEAFVNFIALLGWSPSDGEEIKTLDEIAKDFDLSRLSSSNSIFEYDKLKWMNGHYIRHLPIEDITNRAKAYLTDYDLSKYSEKQLQQIIESTREPISLLSEIKDGVSYFFEDELTIDEDVKNDILKTDLGKEVLEAFLKLCDELKFDDVEEIHHQLEAFRGVFKEKGIKPKQTMWIVRGAITGRTRGADIGVIISVLGKNRVVERVKKAMAI